MEQKAEAGEMGYVSDACGYEQPLEEEYEEECKIKNVGF
jgi:hypothetical protein